MTRAPAAPAENTSTRSPTCGSTTKPPHGDACLLPQGAAIRTTPLSTITGAFILNSILAEATQLALAEGVDVPIYLSGNIPGGAKRNKALIDRFSPRIQPL